MQSTSYELGPLNFQLSGEGNLYSLVSRELKSIESDNANAAIIFHFSDDEPLPPVAGVISDPIVAGKGCYEARHTRLHYSVSSIPKSPVYVDVRCDLSEISSTLRYLRRIRALSWNYLSLSEAIAKNFIYDLFDYWTHIILLRERATYLHASAIEKNDNATVVAGRGGVGKSSFMLKSILEDGYRYLSDDLSVVDTHSVVHYTPKRMQIYGYNTSREPMIRKAVLSKRRIDDLIAWHMRLLLCGPKRVRRRISAEELFGADKVARSARLATAVFLERHTTNKVSVSEIAPDDFSSRCATILLDELMPFATLSIAEHSASVSPVLPSIDWIYRESNEIIRHAVRESRLFHIRVPKNTSPTDLASQLKSALSL